VRKYTATTAAIRMAIPMIMPAAKDSASDELLGCTKQRGFAKQSSNKIHVDFDLHREHITAVSLASVMELT